VDGRQHDPRERGRVGRAWARRKSGVEQALVDLLADLQQRLPVVGGEQPSNAEGVGVVDRRLWS
jgi:hypothetical protein